MTQDEEDDFARELAKMMVSNNENRKVAERKPVSLDVGLPLIRRNKQEMEEDVDGDIVPQKKGMQFTLLTKKGNKQQVSRFPFFEFWLPTNSLNFAGSLDGDPSRFFYCS